MMMILRYIILLCKNIILMSKIGKSNLRRWMYYKMVKWDEIALSNTVSAEQWSKK